MGLKDKLANVDLSGLTSVFKREDNGENDGLRGGGSGGAHTGLGYTKEGGLSRGPWQRFDSGDGSSGDGGVGMLLYLTRGSQVGLNCWNVSQPTCVTPFSVEDGLGPFRRLQSADAPATLCTGLLPSCRALHRRAHAHNAEAMGCGTK